MKGKKRENRKTAAAPTQNAARASRWPYVLVALAAVILVFWAYGPAMSGPFLFDDTALPFALPNFKAPLADWLKADLRPVLFFTYWVNARIGQEDPYSFHVFNVLFHLVSTGLIFVIVRRLLTWRRHSCLPGRDSSRPSPSREDNLLAAVAAAIFLLHPVQTEAVAYLAGRSESLSAMFGLAAFAVFLHRRQAAASWAVAGRGSAW